MLSRIIGEDPGGVRWVRTNPPSSLQYQLFLRYLTVSIAKTASRLASTRWSTGPATAFSVIIDGRVQNFEIS